LRWRPPKEIEEKWLEVVKEIEEKLKLKYGEKTIAAIYAWFRRIYNPIIVKEKLRYFRIEGVLYIVIDDFQYYQLEEKIRKELGGKIAAFKLAFLWDKKRQVYDGVLEIAGYTICFTTHPENLSLLTECEEDIAIVILPYGNFEKWSYIALEELKKETSTLPTILTSAKEVMKTILFEEPLSGKKESED